MDIVWGETSKRVSVQRLVARLNSLPLTDATLYIGYPILSTADENIAADAVLTCAEHGIVIFDLGDYDRGADWNQVEERQAEIVISLKAKLIKHKDLTRNRDLAVPIQIVTFVPTEIRGNTPDNLIFATEQTLAAKLQGLNGMDSTYVRPLNAAIQQVSTIKPPNKRHAVKRGNSRGGILKIIEREVANLDRWQKRAAIECPEGVQRIRGLAGSGKTVVLALKAAYLHTRNPDWTIVVGFQTKSLYEQFRDLIRRFTYEHIDDEPNWNRILVLHAWGSANEPGIYSLIARENNLPCRNFDYAKNMYFADPFEGVCAAALLDLQGRPMKPIFDAILIDEAQDFGQSFFRLAYGSLREPRRFVFAYDELQSLREASLPGLTELFGNDRDGNPLVNIEDVEGKPRHDVILPVCYRNTPWALSMAHALGFGIYRPEGLIQMFDDQSLWRDIGYEVDSGDFTPGHTVTLARRADAAPDFFAKYLSRDDAVQSMRFESEAEQTAWTAERIRVNIQQDELEPSDILVIFADPTSVTKAAGPLIAELRQRDISAHIAGVTSGSKEFFRPGSVVISGIYRAKGNEAPMVYVLGAEYCQEGPGLIKKRNILFSAVTRSRAWVRLCGVGPRMQRLREEWNSVVTHDFKLSFSVPSPEELEDIRRINRDRTERELKKIQITQQNVKDIIDQIENGEIAPEDLPESLRKKLTTLLQKSTSL